jgi:hypothetical protein
MWYVQYKQTAISNHIPASALGLLLVNCVSTTKSANFTCEFISPLFQNFLHRWQVAVITENNVVVKQLRGVYASVGIATLYFANNIYKDTS